MRAASGFAPRPPLGFCRCRPFFFFPFPKRQDFPSIPGNPLARFPMMTPPPPAALPRRSVGLHHARFLTTLAALAVLGGLWWAARAASAPASPTLVPVGVARVDVTPDYPIRLSGYGGRTTVSEGVEQRLWAKALAFGRDERDSAVLLTVDNVGVPFEVTDEVYRRVNEKLPLPRAHFALCSSHTHNGPMLTGVLPNLFSKDIIPEEQATIDRYTRELTDKLVRVALDALQDRQPATVAWGEGQAGFAKNRRTKDGPVDHSLPLLAVRSPEGNLRAVLANYACHCTTLASNLHGGDWAGYAQEYIEAAHPGSTALVSIGCGADANPHPRTGLDFTQAHGREIATEVGRLLGTALRPVTALPTGVASDIALPFDTLPTRAEWERRVAVDGITGYHARKNLARLDRSETLPSTMPYRVQAWAFGDELAMVFLGGEVVVDYATRLKSEYRHLWLHAYANDVRAYIPSTRILREGGYEGGGALPYYDQPARLGPLTEELIAGEVAKVVPAAFHVSKMEGVDPPTSPEESLKRITTKPGFTVELVASEPQIVDPVAIDFGADGRLWVVEMHDYPSGLDGKPGGRVKVLEDPDGDGFYEKATLFLDGLPFPTGVMAWQKGALVCAAPDILYAEDTDGDGRADKVETWFTGFHTENFQARVNGLSYGLDHKIYGANGLLGGVITGLAGGPEVDIRGRDFRIDPSTKTLEPVAGLTQQGRVRNDWGDWFGSDNSNFAWHYPLPERYLRRNPTVAPPTQRVRVEQSPRVFPTSRTLARFNDPEHANRATGACGGGIYRDTLLGAEFYGDYFVNESVHNLTTRLKLQPRGATFTGPRAADEQASEFFSSSDNWSRPVQVLTGPDGALWIVDMYRYVIEHPRWIPAATLAKLDVRAGADKGRIYRVYPKGATLRPVRDLTKLSPSELVAALDTPNGSTRDLIQARLVELGEASVANALAALAQRSDWPATRVQALATLAGLRALKPEMLLTALRDPHPGVRRVALTLSEPFFNAVPDLLATAATLADDPDAAVRYQLALSLGESRSPLAALALGRLARDGMADPWLRTAILTSSTHFPGDVLEAVLTSPADTPGRGELTGGLIATAVASGEKAVLEKIVTALASGAAADPASEAWRFTAWAEFLQALDQRGLRLDDFIAGVANGGTAAAANLHRLGDSAAALAFDAGQPVALRQAALALYGLRPGLAEADLARLASLFENTAEEPLRPAALAALRRQQGVTLPRVLLSDWPRRSPVARAAFVEVLLERDEWLAPLLEALEGGHVSGAEIPVPRRERFLKRADAGLRERAETVFAAFQPTRRADVLAAYKGVADLKGDPIKGREVFQLACGICHAHRGVGHLVGPDLAPFRDKGVPEFLEAILDPNAIIEPRYLNYVVELTDGRSLSGLIGNETANSLTLHQPAGLQETVRRSAIKEMKASPLSLMPEGLEHAIPPPHMADLIAFLKGGAPRPFGSATAESTAVARREFGPRDANGLARITAAATLFDYTSWLGDLPFAHCHQTDGTEKVVWRTALAPGEIASEQPYDFRFPGGLGFLSQPAGSFTLALDGRKELEFGVELKEHQWTNADGSVVLAYEPKEAGPQDSNGIFTLRVRGSRLAAGRPLVLEVTGSAAGSQRWFGVYAYAREQLEIADETSDLPLARQIIAPQTPNARRLEIIRAHPERSAEFLKDMVADLEPGTPEEYRRIPWIWNVTIAAGRRNEAAELRRLLEIALPQLGQPLRDWECVVIGGGLINGVSLENVWPRGRFREIIGDDEALASRWQHSLEEAFVMADNEKVPHGTRYDALRMTPFLPWEKAKDQLTRYLGQDVNAELQQGAVSGLADVEHPDATRLLIDHFAGFTPGNKNFALDALLRGPERAAALLRAMAEKKIPADILGDARKQKLRDLEDPALRDQVRTVLGQP